jgi:hypothetical protein
MFLRLSGLVAALTVLGLAAGCNSQGHSGEACEADASALYPVYSCNAGLVCNTGEATPTCETPNEQALDGPCGEDENCQSGLYCAVSRTCEALLEEGAACPDETGCGPNLICANVPMPTCVAADASLVAPDATVAADASGDAAAEASEAGEPTDAASPGDGGCVTTDDAGDAGPCDGGT